ncbi:G-type lectin S-receptor-like serine/threonine-protein kinase LECRK3 [Quercus lobata]|uniref:G-type lectin S-receptor-like serine/threonine-protein kinase LECRK3 n=1 Tax=Quercus lobata TaxID=97700 RepID=UPI0012458499|nr:G-type lectin S-receptor-like serine/threonine-protein kinase LECRK3 [Quercus lobata]
MATTTLPHCCSLLLLLLILPLLPTVFSAYPKDDCDKMPILPFVARPGIVWFNKTKDPTIVWSANGNKPAPEGSELKLVRNKEFVLNDPDQDSELWKPQMNGSSKSRCFVMLDNGNLVILDEQYNSIWESFNEPTDTILPGQILNMNTTLRSHQSETNYSDGRFEVSLQLDGNFVLYYLLSEKIRRPYFATMTLQWISVLNFTEDGRMYILDANNSTNIYGLAEKNPGSKESFYHRARIDPDGGFGIYRFPRKENPTSDGLESCSSSSWNEVQSIPDDICGRFDANTFVGGFCGLNGICQTLGGSSGVRDTICKCPPQFSYLDPSNYWGGCKPNFPLPSCDNGWEANKGHVTLEPLSYVDWPFSDYSFLEGVNETECKQQCLDDCMCVVTIYEKTGDLCWKKKYPLSNGRYSTNITRKAFIKVLIDPGSEKKGQSAAVVLALLLGSSAFLNILFFSASVVAIIYLYHKRRNSGWNIDSTLATNVRSYTYKELDEATRGFKQIVGKGAFGTVYKGVLASDPKRFVAVKKLGKVVEEGEKEFKTEVSVIGQTHHKNLVRLLGYCDEGQNRLLVYEYMSNGSLASFLFGISRPHWNQRVQIAFGIARGLMYLHEECSTQIIHCDIKPQNILLDEYYTPRIADFGLAKLLLAEQTRAARTGIRGTIGPHWNQRVQIAFGIARGLMYLHEECSTQIIHCDIKPQNILLDEYFTPRIADFGLAKLLLAEQTRAARTGIRGTIGYFAPEWFRKVSISVKVDVYSFGVMLLEIICCKSSVAFSLGEEEALVDWAYECYKDKKLDKLIENDEEARNDMKRLERLVIVAIWCIQEDPSLRPSMKKVTQMLEGVIEVSVPPSPSLFTSSPPSFKK